MRYSTYLPGIQAGGLAAAKDSSVYVAGGDIGGGEKSVVVHVDASGTSVLASTALRGLPGALTVDTAGMVYVTGMFKPERNDANTVFSRAYATRLSADLRKTDYDVGFGDGSVSMGTALAVSSDGSLYVAGTGTTPGYTAYNLIYSEDNALPVADNLAAMLVRIGTDGQLAWQKFIDLPPLDGLSISNRRWPVGLGFGPDGRIWIGLTGATGFPQALHGRDRVPLNGLLLRSFDADGNPTSAGTMIPGLRSFAPQPAAAFGADGRIATVSINPYLPVTPGSAKTGADDGISTVVFDADGSEHPSLITDREIIDADEISLGSTVTRITKLVEVRLSNGGSPEFVAAITPAGDRGLPSSALRFPGFAGDSEHGTMPAKIGVTSLEYGYGDAALAILVPGARGIVSLPIRVRRRAASLQVRLSDPFETPGPTDQI